MIVHAELSAILEAAKKGLSTFNTTLYCPFYSCNECAKAIINSGIKKVIGHAQLMCLASQHTTWIDSIILGWSLLHESGVECYLYDGKFDLNTRFNGKDISI